MGDWSAGKELPKEMFHVRTKVCYHGQWYVITAVHEQGQCYDLAHVDGDGHGLAFASLEELKSGLQQMARYGVGDAVEYHKKRYAVVDRKWSRMAQAIEYRVQAEDSNWVWALEYQLQPWPH